ncbi:hypothetical protein ACSYAD_30635 [Acaryochloris marina NIES-2412]|uniref:hypothetical protein n=1 Tax=Acaryochloris marina TaxID=155978 RepID=UPI0040583687
MVLVPSIISTLTIVLSSATPSQASALEKLSNGDYQFCSQIDPNDGRDGAGVCFNFVKQGDRVDGYYGYPHSGTFVCVRGRMEQGQIAGNGLLLSWPGHPGPSIVPSQYKWQLDSHLTLRNGYLVRSIKEEHGRVEWIQFDEAVLNIDGFHQYSTVKMRPPSQLCKWDEP